MEYLTERKFFLEKIYNFKLAWLKSSDLALFIIPLLHIIGYNNNVIKRQKHIYLRRNPL